MIKLGTIEFDERILDALRDDNLVVFAGAGVSMGPPSNLPDFKDLALSIASGTGQTPKKGQDGNPLEAIDRFLGRLGIDVHERAAQKLVPTGSAPNELHTNLVRLFQSHDRVRLVTTNFDHHFETAAETQFGESTEVFRAPALPRGSDFTGIVYVHGSLKRPKDLVLTDADFGRAYLTEGWARRFLVDVFRQYTVLFVGYSHDDVVMNYLARALPAGDVAGRFALTEEMGNWEHLGITPLHFSKGIGPEAYTALYDGVQKLAERASRGVMDWQNRMTEICSRVPPADPETIGEVEQALREVHTTRFLIEAARSPEWPAWLNARKHLDPLFGISDLGERDNLLALWLAEHYALMHPKAVFELFAAHGVRLNSKLWWSICRELGLSEASPLEDSTLKRWVIILLTNVPEQANPQALMWLAERCSGKGLVHLTLKIFLKMIEHRLSINHGFSFQRDETNRPRPRLDIECPLQADHGSLSEVWENHIKPKIGSIAQPLLAGITRRFEDMHTDLMSWDKASRDWDPVCYDRSAIEPHDQDKYPKDVDVLIDASRESLEWLAANKPAIFKGLPAKLVSSDVPILRRLAIHSITIPSNKSSDQRLKWLLKRVQLDSLAEHHEIHRAIALNYPSASDSTRRLVVDAVLKLSGAASDTWSAEKSTARLHFDWLSRLLRAKPNCTFASEALAPISTLYPDWPLSAHPDPTYWIGDAEWTGHRSPWPVEQILARNPKEQIDDLLNFQEKHFDGPDRNGLVAAVKDACKQKSDWAFALADVLAEKSLWESDLWPAVIRGLKEGALTVDGWRDLLAIAAKQEIQISQRYEIADLLCDLVRNGGKPFTLDLLEQGNAIALQLWYALEADEQDGDTEDWLSRAINRPAGVIVEFWVNGLSLLVHGKTGPERILPENYRNWFTEVVQDSTSKGGLGRTLLASQTSFLFSLDEIWTRQYIIPLFSDLDSQKFSQAWDGFLVWGRLSPALVETLMPAFLGALERLGEIPPNRRRRLIKFYTALMVFHIPDPTQELIPALFLNAPIEDRSNFTSQIANYLSQMQPSARIQLWQSWLRHYWEDRLQRAPSPLTDAEICGMLEWLQHLGDAFPQAVSLAIQAKAVKIEHSMLLYTLKKSDLATRYHDQTAELLIYLCRCEIAYQKADLGVVANRIFTEIDPGLKKRLEESLVRIGVKLPKD